MQGECPTQSFWLQTYDILNKMGLYPLLDHHYNQPQNHTNSHGNRFCLLKVRKEKKKKETPTRPLHYPTESVLILWQLLLELNYLTRLQGALMEVAAPSLQEPPITSLKTRSGERGCPGVCENSRLCRLAASPSAGSEVPTAMPFSPQQKQLPRRGLGTGRLRRAGLGEQC